MITRLAILTSKQLAKFILAGSFGALLVLLVAGVMVLESQPDLKPWHKPLLTEEFRVGNSVASFGDYLELEKRLFSQLDRQILDGVGPEDQSRINRYHRGSLSDPEIWPQNWNRSYVLERTDPEAVFVLIHGMSDSPYSLSNLALTLHERGGEVIGLRLPGHGTIPAGLLEATWQDMAAAVELAASEAERRAGTTAPVYLVGYSIGAALAVHHSLSALEGGANQVDGLILISPAIGLPRLARLAAWQSRMGRLLGLRKVAWSSINLEYDPFKYGSFAINAAYQSYLLTEEIKADLVKLHARSALGGVPPILAFQSAVDATVSSQAVIDSLFRKLPDAGHELVLFDVNRMTDAIAVLANDPRPMIEGLLAQGDITFTLSQLTNAAPDIPEVVVRRRVPGLQEIREETTGLSWPSGIFSLSHVALPFPASDLLYGDGTTRNSPGIELGILALRGERGALRISAVDMLRLRWNPFYSYLEKRVLEFVKLY